MVDQFGSRSQADVEDPQGRSRPQHAVSAACSTLATL